MSEFEQRFGGIGRLYGTQALERLRQAHVAVIGIGGVGSWAAEALARSGIGKLTLIDLDEVCVTNTNRQIHALDGTIGRAKAGVMAERIQAINSECRVQAVEDFLALDNLAELIAPDLDAVLDAIDNARVKAALVAYCLRRKLPLVCVGGAGGKRDPTQVRVADLNRSERDPLLARVRQHLKRFHNLSRSPGKKFGVECVYSPEAPVYPWADGTICAQRPTAEGPLRLDCAGGFGAATHVTGTFAFFAVARVLRRLLSQPLSAQA
ncbi:MAG TPA: tRNA cyclic N6-threonylcarbamoyladenosine(37) synthase TcdA [Candidatus Competibacteraceae bacterium]|nr:tRNA cyclic N6-threonylcarbamoyladenosine(37) synthase TcdA [Candidatus Competibacteraceae bacterium]